MENYMKEDRNIYQHIFYKFLEMTDDGFIVTDSDGIITDVNELYCKFLKVKKKNVLGKSILEIIPNSKLIDIMKNRYTEEGVIHTYMGGNTLEMKAMINRSYVEDNDGEIIGSIGQARFKFQALDIAKKFMAEYEELEFYKEEYRKTEITKFSFDSIIGSCSNFMKIKNDGLKAAKTNFSVLLTGETGTGKEIFAKVIHYASPRAQKPMICIDCASIPEELMESELFGYEEGAFTGAKKGGKKGKLSIANGGTIFFDEIGDMPLKMQSKLLRVLQERKIEPIGSLNVIPIDVRIIAATRKNLSQMIKTGEFREDLFYRLNVINIEMIPLRERKDDIMEMANQFLEDLNQEMKGSKKFATDIHKCLRKYDWPGNIRELENVIKSAYASSNSSYIDLVDLPLRIVNDDNDSDVDLEIPLLEVIKNYEKELLKTALKKSNWNCDDAAKKLKISRSAIYKKIKKYGLSYQMKKN
jgi:PAS domain S-box-containing protein